ncbi:PREDICTED: uncharacterized protein LOC108560498, partial [Nicrophorus vespilloides]|uniref:Uncharacterized protein LOC108560498 n=1 Tax=Nicrophorus vespilloides TaxID=110193 RepID=A0ABM1MG57_NICVS
MHSIVRVATGLPINLMAPSSKLVTQYPKEWFDKHPNKKPRCTIDLTSSDLGKCRGVIKGMIDSNNLTLDYVKTFLYFFYKEITMELDDDWKSYGLTLGVRGEDVTPLSILDIQTVDNPKESSGTGVADKADDAWIAIYLLGIYRMIRTTVQEYKTTVAQKISEQMKAHNQNAPAMTEVVDSYTGWDNDRSFRMLVGCVDMFMFRFPNHKYANFRIGTTGSRFRDCTALLSISHVSTKLGLPNLEDLMEWVFVEAVGEDVARMMKDGEEVLEPFSYFPYQMDFNLVLKSSYSAAELA